MVLVVDFWLCLLFGGISISSLNLGSDLSRRIMKSHSFKDVLDFMDKGLVKIGGSGVYPVRRCSCGRLAKYVRVRVESLEFLECDCEFDFLCEGCYKNL